MLLIGEAGVLTVATVTAMPRIIVNGCANMTTALLAMVLSIAKVPNAVHLAMLSARSGTVAGSTATGDAVCGAPPPSLPPSLPASLPSLPPSLQSDQDLLEHTLCQVCMDLLAMRGGWVLLNADKAMEATPDGVDLGWGGPVADDISWRWSTPGWRQCRPVCGRPSGLARWTPGTWQFLWWSRRMSSRMLSLTVPRLRWV